MNIITVTVGAAVMGTLMPGVMRMSIAPFEAQVRAQNYAVAETAAVTYVAANEWTTSLNTTPAGCTNPVKLASGAYSITYTEGEGNQYVQSVTRSFRLDDSCDDNDGDNGHGNSGGHDCSNPGNSGFVKDLRVFDFPPPPGFTGHQCLITENWGLDTDAFDREKNKWKGESCTPNAAWHNAFYLESDPNAWMYDINKHNGWGEHPDY